MHVERDGLVGVQVLLRVRHAQNCTQIGKADPVTPNLYRDPVSAEQLLSGLDAEQREAVTTTAAPLAIVAAAGSGKTTVLTRRIAYRLATEQVRARHVLALTFTRDAAAELKRRLRRFDLREPVEAGTFHSVALRLLRDRATARNQPLPQLSNDRLALVRGTVQQLRLRIDPYAAAIDIDWARARMVLPEQYEGACRLNRRRSAIPPARYAEFVDAYDTLKRRRGVVDFDDLLGQLLHALRTDPAWAEGIRWRYRHLFVDEAQDLNPLQHAVLEALRNGRADLCLVGDPRQAIYGWNGADHTTLSEVERRYPGVTVIELGTNYRCSPQVVRAAAAALGASGQVDLTRAHQPDAAGVTVAGFSSDVDEAEGVARHVRDLLHQRSGRDLAVLARTNDQITAVQRAFERFGIPTERSAGRSPLDQAVAAVLRCTNRDQLAAWVDTAHLDGDTLLQRVADEVDRFLVSGESGTFRAWLDARHPFDDLDPGPAAEAVSLLTFHAAKGREWWGVVVVGAEDGLVPHSSSVTPAQLAEEARLFYVALTRASHHLLVTYAAKRNGRTAIPSRWLAAVQATIAADQPTPPPTRMRHATVDPLLPFREWRDAVARASGQPPAAVCNDRVLRSLLADPPGTALDLAARLGITESAAQRLRPLPSPVS
jgi:DNA helicase-2/ATP-dependent DNA helicase PcrA